MEQSFYVCKSKQSWRSIQNHKKKTPYQYTHYTIQTCIGISWCFRDRNWYFINFKGNQSTLPEDKKEQFKSVIWTWRSDNLFQPNNILMIKLLQNLDFTNCRSWKLQKIQNLRLQSLKKRIHREKICMKETKMYILHVFHLSL